MSDNPVFGIKDVSIHAVYPDSVMKLAVMHGYAVPDRDQQVWDAYNRAEDDRHDNAMGSVVSRAADFLRLISDPGVTWKFTELGGLILMDTAEELAEEFGAEVDAVKAFASYHGGYDFTEEQFNEAYLGEAYDDSDTALKKWFFEEWLEEVSSDVLEEFLNLAQELAIRVDYHDVDTIAVKQDVTNENGYIFRTDY